MIEETVRKHLAGELDVPVYMELPEKPPAAFVLVEKTGSNHIESSMMAVQAYAGTMLEAAQLNEAVKQAMDSLALLSEVCAARLNSDYNFTDTASKLYRYQAVYDITHY